MNVYNGEKAIETVDSNPDISLILMDIDLGSKIDGTETAEELRDSEEKFRTMMNQSIDMIFLHDLEGNIVEVN